MKNSVYVSQNENLEKIKPALDKALESFMGLKIESISDEIIKKLKENKLNVEFQDSWTLEQAKLNFKKNYLMEILREVNGNITKASVISGIDRRTIHRLITSFNIDVDGFRNLPYQFSKTKIDNYIKFVVSDVLKQYNLTKELSDDVQYKLQTKELVEVIKKPFPTMDEAYEEYEKQFLIAVIAKNNKILKDACKQLHIARETLSRKISKYGINVKEIGEHKPESKIKLEELI